MRLTIAIFAAFLAELRLGSAFVVDSSLRRRSHDVTRLSAEASTADDSSAPAKTKPTTAADILARARKAAGLPDEEEAPKIFEDELLDDMQQLLLTLEKRVKEGPGSVSLLEIDQMEAMQSKIMVDMREKESERLNGVNSAAAPHEVAAPAIASAVDVTPNTDAEASAPPTPEVVKSKEIIDTSNDEGPAYEGYGGMGLAKGTANTYIIDGMDAMSPEEYQKALQETISARQRKRISDGKTTGNRATWDYLHQLTGESGVLKKEEYDDSE